MMGRLHWSDGTTHAAQTNPREGTSMNKRLYFLLAFLAGCPSTGLENIPLPLKPTPATLTAPGGYVLWSGLGRRAAARRGRSYRADNYYETLSDSLVGAVQQLIQNRGFHKALAGSSRSE